MIKRFFRRLYRKIWDFPFNWKPYGWKKWEMKDWYWQGFRDCYFN
jgi:hypothetical protein